MKPAAFDYIRPATVDETVGALSDHPEARVLAGGQTLVPMLAMRLSRPSHLVDIAHVPELSGIAVEGDRLTIKAATRQAAALASEEVARAVPLLGEALRHVGHPPTRARGTVGGSLAHGDPSAEIALAASILGARIAFRTRDGEECFAPDEFYFGPTVTAAPEGGLLTHVTFPCRDGRPTGAGFDEIASRRADYAFASAGAQVVLAEDGTCAEARLGVGSIGDAPEALDVTDLEGTRLTADAIAEVVAAAMADVEAESDLHASAAYRKRAAAHLARRALAAARDAALVEGEAA